MSVSVNESIMGKNNSNHKYTMNDSVLTTDTEVKDVGVTFDNMLEFRLHIRNIIAKAIPE